MSSKEAFDIAVIEHLGLAALTGGKLSPIAIAEMFWNSGYRAGQEEMRTRAADVADISLPDLYSQPCLDAAVEEIRSLKVQK